MTRYYGSKMFVILFKFHNNIFKHNNFYTL